ncbi:MAG: PEP-CTERM sorting domain-containing protein [Candidatus Korobacteraceae bacterium]
MKLRVASLSLLALGLTLAAVPASAQVVYNNGPIYGNTDAWTFNFGFIQSDSFTVSGGNSTLTGLSFGAWLFPGDTLTSAEVWITSNEGGGTSYFNQVVSFAQSGCQTNNFGYDVCTEMGSFHGPSLNNGTYWLNLENGVVPSGDPVYWDENSGIGCTSPGCPSEASNNSVGTMPSEAFTILGTSSSTSTSTSTTTTGTVPEPGSIMLFGSGILGLVGMLRRKLF